MTVSVCDALIEVFIYTYAYLVTMTRCLKITEKVSLNIASEASYVYILSGQKEIEMAQNGQFSQYGEFLKTWSSRSNSVTKQVNFK